MHSTQKIDFFGGLHGNYLELVINHAIDQNNYDITNNQFLATGACHVKNSDASYHPITRALHYSFLGQTFDDNDFVVRIVPGPDDMLIALTNSLLRAGDQVLDLDCLQQDTYKKMFSVPKLRPLLQLLIDNHGFHTSYPRHVLRHYFGSMFAVPEHGLHKFVQWLPAKQSHNFDFSSFFSFEKFYRALQDVAKFLNLEFLPSVALIDLHKSFLRFNQGWHSHVKCSKILESMIMHENVALDLNIIEEAWISWKVSEIFNLFDLDCLLAEEFPKQTSTIIEEIQQHYQKRSLC